MIFFEKKLKKHPLDKNLLWVILVLVTIGLVTFISASLGVYADHQEKFWAMIVRHVGLGVFGGLGIMVILSRVNYNFWQKAAPYIFGLAIIITLLVFTPLGFSHGGARRWISLGFISFQPAELLKFGVVIMVSAWFAGYSSRINEWKYGLLAFFCIVGIAILALVKQPDSGTIVLIGLVGFIIYWLRGAPWKHILITLCIGLAFVGTYVAINPYIIERFKTFTDANRDPYGSSFQIRQSRIAIGSGKLYGRGLGQSVHKFGPYLPESNSDSIFAIFAEEYGFIGSTLLIGVYLVFSFFGLRVARRAPTLFAQNLVIGIVLMIVVQVFFNIAAISGLVPLSGLPLIFMSNGGTALIVTLAQLGIVLNISRHQKIEQEQRKRIVNTINPKKKAH